MEEEKNTIAKAITINGTNALFKALDEKKVNITRHFLKNQSAIKEGKIRSALGDKLYFMLINGEIDLITYHILDKYGDINNKIEVMQEWYY